MAETVSGLVAEAIAQGSFDASSPDVLKWLNRRHKEMVNFARAYRDRFTIGTTVAAQQDYPMTAGVVELNEVTVDGVTWSRGRHTDVAADANGWLWLSGTGGLFVPGVSTSSVSVLRLVPAPTDAGLLIVGEGAVSPPDLLIDDTVAIVVDDDSIEGLLAGVFATALNRPNESRPDLAGVQQALFETAKVEFKRRVARRLRGSGPTMIRLG